MPETATNKLTATWEPDIAFSARAFRAMDRYFDSMRAKRKEWRDANKSEVEVALDGIIRLTYRMGFMRAHGIARQLGAHSGTVERALDLGIERGCIVRRQLPDAKRPYYEYSLSDGTRSYLLVAG